MNERLKFRFWHEDTKCMYEDTGLSALGVNNSIEKALDCGYIPMQSTGLKDKSGKLIYEGDIVKSHLYEYSFEVVWVQSLAHFELLSYIDNRKGLGILSSEDIDKYQMWRIIGNIYENKELLNETK